MSPRAYTRWTYDFIRDFGWSSYLTEIVWDAMIVYRLKTWRCELFGHQLGPQEDYWEEYWVVESWRACTRPHCEHSVQVWDAALDNGAERSPSAERTEFEPPTRRNPESVA